MFAKQIMSISLVLGLCFGLPGPALVIEHSAPLTDAPGSASPSSLPDGLQRAILDATGRPFTASREGYQARAGGLDFSLKAGSLQAGGEGMTWKLALDGFGRGKRVAPVAEAEVSQADDRLEYRRGSLTEWYRATALGLEQGFTIHQPPPGPGPLVLQFTLSSDMTVEPDADGRGLSFTDRNGRTLRYDHLLAWDAGGAPLEATLRCTSGQIALQVHDEGARYPITIDPLVYQQQKVQRAYGEDTDSFGSSVALDGDTALVGAYMDDVDGIGDQGSAYIFVRSGATWSLQQKLTAPDGAVRDFFGYSVALAGDTALVGAYLDIIGEYSDQGSVYVFVRSGTTWGFQQKLTAPDGAQWDYFGYSVALAGDTALVGSPESDVSVMYASQGAAYVFTRSGTTWSLEQKLTAADGAIDDWFGVSVALSGETALVGSHNSDIGANTEQGSAYVFTRSGTTWSQQQKLTALDGEANDFFGHSVALSGETALVGAVGDDIGGNIEQGSAYVFTRSGTTWSQQQKLTAPDGEESDFYGDSVALSGDTALVGAQNGDDDAGTEQGSAYVFVRSGTTWSFQQELTAADGAPEDKYGIAVALSGDTALVGAMNDSGQWHGRGSAHAVVRSGTTWTEEWELTAPDGPPDYYFGSSVAISGDTALVGVPGDYIGTNGNQGSVFIFTRSGTGWETWLRQAILTAGDGAAGDQFGCSVALSGDTALVGACLDDLGANIDQGSAYIFVRSGTTWTQQGQLTAPDGAAGDNFGNSVALAGETALVGAPHAEGGKGSAYAFVRSGTTWSLEQELTAPDGATGDGFGGSVALSGETALVGAALDDLGANADQGSAYVFIRSGTTWAQQGHLTAADGAAGDNFGSSVGLSGNIALAGATGNDVGANVDQGSAYYFRRSGTTWILEQKLTTYDGAAGDNFGSSVGLSGATTLVGAYKDSYNENANQGSAYFFNALLPISPAGTVIGVAAPTFAWSALPEATAYRLAVYSYPAADYVVLNTVPTSYCNATQCSYPSPVNLSNGNYKFKLLGYLPGGTITAYTSWLAFTITGVPLPPPAFPPTPISPSGTVATHRPTFQWSSVPNATFYRLSVYAYATETYPLVLNIYPTCLAGVCSYTSTTLDLENGNYRFKVMARNSSGSSAYSGAMYFTVSSTLPVAPTLLAPSGTLTTNRPQFQWKPVSGATKYRLAVYSNTLGYYILVTDLYPSACSGPVCSYSPPFAFGYASYKFKMLTCNPYGCSGYSDFMRFNVQ